MLKGIIRSAAIAAIIVAAVPSPSRAQEIEVVLVLPALTLSYAAAWISEDAGIYKKNGLKVDTRQLVGVAANNAVINGAADFAYGTAGTYLNGVAKGQRLLLLANMVNRPSSELVMRKDVAEAMGITNETPIDQRIKAIKGKTIAIGGIGSAPHAWLRLLANKAGLDAENDFVTAPVDATAQVASMLAKRVDGISAPPPFSSEAIVKHGAVVIASPAQGDLPEYFPTASTVLMARPETCQKQREKCLRMTKSVQDAVALIMEKPAEAWAIIQKRNPRMDPQVLEGAWAVSSKIYTKDMRITDKMLDVAQKYSIDAGLIQPQDAVTDYKGLYTDEFLSK
jgi:NitT/TauT family transport system substrate-binding protein